MSSKQKVKKNVDCIMNFIRIHKNTFGKNPIQKGNILSFEKGFPIIWIKVSQKELSEINKRLENEK